MCNRYCVPLALLALLGASPAPAQPLLWDVPNPHEAARLAGEWTAVDGIHAGKVLTKDLLAKIKFSAGNGYGIELGPLVPKGNWPTGYFCTLIPSFKRLSFGRNIGFKGIRYYGFYEVTGDTLRMSLQLLPWERSTGDPGFGWDWTFQADTVLRFKKAAK